MNDFENKLMELMRLKEKIKLQGRYVDDVLLIWEGNIEE